jgi:hypothetical protein
VSPSILDNSKEISDNILEIGIKDASQPIAELWIPLIQLLHAAHHIFLFLA